MQIHETAQNLTRKTLENATAGRNGMRSRRGVIEGWLPQEVDNDRREILFQSFREQHSWPTSRWRPSSSLGKVCCTRQA